MAEDILGQAAQDVIADPSPAGEAAPEAPAPASEDSGGKKRERTIDEVRGELVRKLEEANASHREQLARIEGMLAARPAPAAQQNLGAPDVGSMSSDQLEALRPSIPKEQLAAFDKMVGDRRIAESVRGVVSQELGRRDVVTARKAANQEAFARYPDLHNTTSPLRKMTNKVLEERGETGASPNAVLDAANEAASRLGITAKRRVNDGPEMGSPGGRTGPAPGTKSKETLPKERADAIARALQGALPRGKKFDIERIQEGHRLYTEHRGLIIKQ